MSCKLYQKLKEKIVFIKPKLSEKNIIYLVLATVVCISTGVVTYKSTLIYSSKNCILKLDEQQKTINNLQSSIYTQNRTIPNCNNSKQLYEQTSVKEFYVLKTSESKWTKFTSELVGISFDYPVDANILIKFEYNDWLEGESDPRGIEFKWMSENIIAVGVSNDLLLGRDGIAIYKWTENDGKYYVHTPTEDIIGVKKLMVKDTLFGTKALLFENPCTFMCDNPEMAESQKISRLIVNLPQNHRPKLESIIFNIPDNFEDKDIDQLIDSIRLTD